MDDEPVDVTQGWQLVAIVGENEPVLFDGVDLWSATWVPVGASHVSVTHPDDPRQVHEMTVYRVGARSPVVLFAAGEFANGVWGFYRPKESMREFLSDFRV